MSGFVCIKFIYSEKAAIFCEISTVDLSYVVTVRSTVEISKKCGLLRIYELYYLSISLGYYRYCLNRLASCSTVHTETTL